jgi:hypothetical protein
MAVSAEAIDVRERASERVKRWPWWGSAVTLGAFVMFWLGQAFPHLAVVQGTVWGLREAVIGPFEWLEAIGNDYGITTFVIAGQLLWALLLAIVVVALRKHLIPAVVWVLSLWVGSYVNRDAIPTELGEGWASLWQTVLRDRPELGAVVVGTLLFIALYPTGKAKHWMEIATGAATVLVLLAWPSPVVLMGIVPMVAVYVHHLGLRATGQRLHGATARLLRAAGVFAGELRELWGEREELERPHPAAALPARAAGVLARCSREYLIRVLARGGSAWLRVLTAGTILGWAVFELPAGAKTEVLLLGASLLFASLAFATNWRFSGSVAFYWVVAALVAWPPGSLPLVLFALVKACAWVLGSLAILVEIDDAVGFDDYVREKQLAAELAGLRAEALLQEADRSTVTTGVD